MGMKAIVIHGALDLRVEERAPATPGPEEVSIAIRRGGICGSDLHYYQHGGFGTIRLKEPMILGHEIAGEVAAIGAKVTGLKVGDRVAVNPSRPCKVCAYCQAGMQNHCLDMLFYGSAMRMPHVQGAFRQSLVALESQCHIIAPGVSLEEAAFAEPFAVTLHAISRAGALTNKRVLVTGCGPIGALAIIAARAHGARRIGADRIINVATQMQELAPLKANKGAFDVMIEASGNEQAILTGLDVLKPRGILVQLGLGGSMGLPQNLVVSKEVEIRGSFRFHEEFALAVDLINRRRVDLTPLLTKVLPLDQAEKAFQLASDRSRAMKVQIAF
jgi:L-idonate 5-dehydrogenase